MIIREYLFIMTFSASACITILLLPVDSLLNENDSALLQHTAPTTIRIREGLIFPNASGLRVMQQYYDQSVQQECVFETVVHGTVEQINSPQSDDLLIRGTKDVDGCSMRVGSMKFTANYTGN